MFCLIFAAFPLISLAGFSYYCWYHSPRIFGKPVRFEGSSCLARFLLSKYTEFFTVILEFTQVLQALSIIIVGYNTVTNRNAEFNRSILILFRIPFS